MNNRELNEEIDEIRHDENLTLSQAVLIDYTKDPVVCHVGK